MYLSAFAKADAKQVACFFFTAFAKADAKQVACFFFM